MGAKVLHLFFQHNDVLGISHNAPHLTHFPVLQGPLPTLVTFPSIQQKQEKKFLLRGWSLGV